MTFDARSLITQRTDGKGQVETRLYDALGRQTGSQYADGTIVTTTFDLLGRKLTEANQNGVWTRSYDALGQRLTELGPGYPSGLPLTSVYDPIGQRTQLQCWRGVQTWGYDAIHRPRTLVDIEGGRYTWSYEPHGRLSELDYPNGVVFTATYGSNGWPYQASYASAGTQIELLVWDVFDQGINWKRLTEYWGGALQNRRNLTFDAANQMTHWEDSNTRGPVTVFDPAGNPATAQVNNGAEVFTYTYDGADELTNYATTNAGSWAFGSATFSYDGNGCRIGEQFYQIPFSGGSRTDLTTYTWDAAGHLLSIQQTNAGAVNLTSTYRPDGLRHQRTDNSGTTQVIWDGDDPLAQVDTSGNLIEFWNWAPALPGGNWSRLVKNRYPTTNAHPDQYVHSDWRGTVQALSLPGGTALAQYGSSPEVWGEGENSSTVGPLSWLGNHGYWAETQLARPLHYVRARWYMDGNEWSPPGWLSPDPLGFGGGDVNLYRYVGNRPTVRVDPSGMQECHNIGRNDWPTLLPNTAASFTPPPSGAVSFCSALPPGDPFTEFGPNASKNPCCTCKCAEYHEAVHRADYSNSGCCSRWIRCAMNAVGNQGAFNDCANSLFCWGKDIKPWTECNAYKAELTCLQALFHATAAIQTSPPPTAAAYGS